MSLRLPNKDEIDAALGAAEQMRADDNDPQHIALVLRYLHDRCNNLEALLNETERFLRFGMPETELSQMRLLVTRLRSDGPKITSSAPLPRENRTIPRLSPANSHSAPSTTSHTASDWLWASATASMICLIA